MEDKVSWNDLALMLHVRHLRSKTIAGWKLKKSEMRQRLDDNTSLAPSVSSHSSQKRNAMNWWGWSEKIQVLGGKSRKNVKGQRVRLSIPQMTRWVAKHSSNECQNEQST